MLYLVNLLALNIKGAIQQSVVSSQICMAKKKLPEPCTVNLCRFNAHRAGCTSCTQRSEVCTCDGSSPKHVPHTEKRRNQPIRDLVSSQVPGCTRGAISYVIVHRRTPAGNKEWIYNRYYCIHNRFQVSVLLVLRLNGALSTQPSCSGQPGLLRLVVVAVHRSSVMSGREQRSERTQPPVSSPSFSSPFTRGLHTFS